MFKVPGGIAAIAKDGRRIAYDEAATRKTCDRIFVIDVTSGRKKRVSGCRADSGSRELAVADGRVAWIITECGNSECDDDLSAAAFPRLTPHLVATAHVEGDVGTDELEGTVLGGLVGSRAVLAANRFTIKPDGAIPKAGLYMIVAKRLRLIASGPKTVFAQEADDGRIAVLRQDGTLGIYSTNGNEAVEVRPSAVRERFRGYGTALQGGRLLVLTATGTLEMYNSHTGGLVRSWRVTRGAAALDAYGGLAVYVQCCRPHKLHVLRLATGRDVVLDTTMPLSDSPSVQLEASGVVAYVKTRRTLAFLPFKRLLAAVSAP